MDEQRPRPSEKKPALEPLHRDKPPRLPVATGVWCLILGATLTVPWLRRGDHKTHSLLPVCRAGPAPCSACSCGLRPPRSRQTPRRPSARSPRPPPTVERRQSHAASVGCSSNEDCRSPRTYWPHGRLPGQARAIPGRLSTLFLMILVSLVAHPLISAPATGRRSVDLRRACRTNGG